MGMTHAAGWANTPAEIAGVISENPVSLQAMAHQYGATAHNNLASLINDVDVVDICTPTHLHHAMVMQAAAAGKHIVCEKPLARTVQQAQEMITACREAGVMLLVAHVVRFFPEYVAAKATVERGEIGKVAVMRLTRASFRPRLDDSWFHDHEKSGGMMLDLMIHDFDYARWIAGDVVSVFAKNVSSKNGPRGEDYGLAILKHKSGALSHIEGAWAYPKPMFRTALEIAGDRGLIEHPAGSSVPLEIFMKDNGAAGDEADIAVPGSPLAEDPFTTEMKHFYAVLSGETVDLRVTAYDGLAAVRIALAALESARTGRPVKVEDMN
jgi:predicted dehydrogenase